MMSQGFVVVVRQHSESGFHNDSEIAVRVAMTVV